MQEWARQSRYGIAECPSELENNLTDLCAAALHDGANDFFPMRTGNVEIGGRGILGPSVKPCNTLKGGEIGTKIADVESKDFARLKARKSCNGAPAARCSCSSTSETYKTLCRGKTQQTSEASSRHFTAHFDRGPYASEGTEASEGTPGKPCHRFKKRCPRVGKV